MRTIQPQRNEKRRSRNILGAIIGVSIVMALVGGLANGTFDWRGMLMNLSTELIGGVITFVIIDQVISVRENEERERDQLIREMENPDNGLAARAVADLRSRGWLQDGSLAGWFLQRANIEGINLRDADLTGFGLYRCSLKDTRVHEKQLVSMSDLRLTVMPDGELYDGRYCLKGDLNWAMSKYDLDVKTATFQQMADYYGVPLERYIEGQRWARENLPKYGLSVPQSLLPDESAA